jgi:hypothetical protein
MLKSLIVLTGLYALTVSGCSTSPYTAYPHYREFQVSDHDVLILLDIRVEREDLPEEEVERILNMGGEVLGYADMVLRLKGYEKRKMMLVSVRVFNGSGRRGGSTGSNENGMVYIDPAFTVSEEMQTAVLGTLQSVHVRRKSARSPNIHIPETKKSEKRQEPERLWYFKCPSEMSGDSCRRCNRHSAICYMKKPDWIIIPSSFPTLRVSLRLSKHCRER